MKKHLFTLLVGLAVESMAQIGANPKPLNTGIDMYPKTPEAAALSKFIDIPAGNYTGVADFTIPLYTIEFDGKKIPIELKYTTTGVKVGQIATRVGLGWTLITGPHLSQQVMGFRDMDFPKPLFPENETFYPHPTNYPHYNLALRALGLSFSYGQSDLRPDIFTYGLLDKSGRFIFDYTGVSGIPMPYNQIKISRPSNFVINMIDEEGFSYQFFDSYGGLKTRNTCTEANVEAEFDYFDPNYAINRIISPRNEVISYIYDPNIPYSTYISSVSTQKRISISGYAQPPAFLPPETRNKCLNYTTSRDAPLTEIHFKGGKVVFTYNNRENNQRLDIKDEIFLTGIKVINDRNQVIKDFTLNYGYFLSPGGIPDIPQHSDPKYSPFKYGLDSRLKLTGVTDNLTQGTHQLEYYESWEGKVLPNRLSNDQDYWGVFNGKGNGEKSIAESPYARPIPPNIHSVYLGADKNPNINYGRLGNLRKIKYPTGGHSEIWYDADEFDLPNPEIVYEYEEIPNEIRANNEASPLIIMPFTITASSINQQIEFKKVNAPPTTTTGPCQWKLRNLSTGAISDGYTVGIFTRNDGPGEYELWVEKDEMPSVKCYAYYTWTDLVATPVDTITSQKVGTIRVSKIESITGTGTKIERRYSYLEPTTNHILPYSKGSGKNLGEELFIPRSWQKYPTDNFGNFALEDIASDNPGWQTATVRGKAVGYDYVQEHYIDHANPTNSYRKEYKFKNGEYGTYHDPNALINVTWPSGGLDRGLILEEILFNSEGKPVRKTVNNYQYDGHFNSKYAATEDGYFSMGKGLEIIPVTRTGPLGANYTFEYVPFDLTNYWVTESNTTITEYSYKNNVMDSLQIEKTFVYSPTYKHTFQKEIITGGSRGETLKTQYRYPQDVLMNDPEYGMAQKLIEKNQISKPVITKMMTDNTVTSETRNIYGQFSSETGTMVLPKAIYLKKGENATEVDRKITYKSYDVKGNLTQYNMENGIPVTIIWGYGKTLPIAKIEGAEFDLVKDNSLVTAAITAAENDNVGMPNQTPEETEQALNSALDALRKGVSFKDFLITTYTYDPLIGVKSVTPPSGIREYYFYDDAGRLQSVKIKEKDANGQEVYRILKEYEYHYKQ